MENFLAIIAIIIFCVAAYYLKELLDGIERKQAIGKARKRPNLYSDFDTPTGLEEIKKYEQACKPVPWAKAIQRRYNIAETALNDAMIVVNDDIEKLDVYRKKLHKNELQKYENTIKPFKNDLALMADKIPYPKGLTVKKNFSFPKDMQPKEIKRKINKSTFTSNIQIQNFINSRKMSSSGWKKEDSFIVAIQAILALIRYQQVRQEQLTAVTKLQADVDKDCEQMKGAIKALREASEEIEYLRKQHENAVEFMKQYFSTVQNIANNKSLNELSSQERQSVESLYIGGKQLIRLMEVDITKADAN